MLKKKKVDARTLDARTLDARTLDARTLDARSTLVAVGYMKGGLLDRRTLDSAAQCRRREMRLAADLLKCRARALAAAFVGRALRGWRSARCSRASARRRDRRGTIPKSDAEERWKAPGL